MGSKYIFYADVYFVQNFVIKAGILWLTIKTMKIPLTKPVIRSVGIAGIGTIIEIAGLFFIPNYQVMILLNHLVLIPGMMLLLYWKKWDACRKGILWGYFFALLMNGIVEFYWILFGSGWLYPLLVLFACVSVIIGTCHIMKRWRMKKGVYPINLHCRHIIWSTKGYYDTGNCLKDPYTGKGVHIISRTLCGRLHLMEEGKVCIPYQSMGNPKGLMDVYYIDGMEIYKDSGWVKLERVPIGVAEESLFAGKCYEMILNEEV